MFTYLTKGKHCLTGHTSAGSAIRCRPVIDEHSRIYSDAARPRWEPMYLNAITAVDSSIRITPAVTEAVRSATRTRPKHGSGQGKRNSCRYHSTADIFVTCFDDSTIEDSSGTAVSTWDQTGISMQFTVRVEPFTRHYLYRSPLHASKETPRCATIQ